MTEPTHDIEVEITRVPFTTPCPVRITPDCRSFDEDGEVLPDEERTEFCAVDAGWMIGKQRLCDIHLREACELLAIDGSLEAIIAETFGSLGREFELHALERANVPWSERARYTQDEARDFHERAVEQGLA